MVNQLNIQSAKEYAFAGAKNYLNLLRVSSKDSDEFITSFRELLYELKVEFKEVSELPPSVNSKSQEFVLNKERNLINDIIKNFGSEIESQSSKTPTNPKWEEIIVVAPSKKVFSNGRLKFQGTEQDEIKVNKIIANLSKNYTSMRRGSLEDSTDKENNAEINVDYKQPIPYVLIKRGNEIFAYERLNGGGESRLHNKISLGVGGHINPEEGSFEEILMNNLNRELEEELSITSDQKQLKFIGLINDDEDEVGKVHLGILATLELSEDAIVEVKEKEQLNGYWSTIEELKSEEVYDRLENWSKITVDIL